LPRLYNTEPGNRCQGLKTDRGRASWAVANCPEFVSATCGPSTVGISANIDHSDVTVLLNLLLLIGDQPPPVPLQLSVFHGAGAHAEVVVALTDSANE
jgi:hypothetical protein